MAGLQVFVVCASIFTAVSGSHMQGGTVSFRTTEKTHSGWLVDFKYKSSFIDGYSGNYFYWGCYDGDCGYEINHWREPVENRTSYPSRWYQYEGHVRRRVDNDKPFQLWENSCCWVANNYNEGGWSMTTFVDLGIRSDTQMPNSSPVTTIIPIIRIPQNCGTTINLLGHDPDGDLVSCRHGYGSPECEFCHYWDFPVDHNQCSVSVLPWMSTGSYVLELILEDFPRDDIYLTYNDGTQIYKSRPYNRKRREIPKDSQKYYWYDTSLSEVGTTFDEESPFTTESVTDIESFHTMDMTLEVYTTDIYTAGHVTDTAKETTMELTSNYYTAEKTDTPYHKTSEDPDILTTPHNDITEQSTMELTSHYSTTEETDPPYYDTTEAPDIKTTPHYDTTEETTRELTSHYYTTEETNPPYHDTSEDPDILTTPHYDTTEETTRERTSHYYTTEETTMDTDPPYYDTTEAPDIKTTPHYDTTEETTRELTSHYYTTEETNPPYHDTSDDPEIKTTPHYDTTEETTRERTSHYYTTEETNPPFHDTSEDPDILTTPHYYTTEETTRELTSHYSTTERNTMDTDPPYYDTTEAPDIKTTPHYDTTKETTRKLTSHYSTTERNTMDTDPPYYDTTEAPDILTTPHYDTTEETTRERTSHYSTTEETTMDTDPPYHDSTEAPEINTTPHYDTTEETTRERTSHYSTTEETTMDTDPPYHDSTVAPEINTTPRYDVTEAVTDVPTTDILTNRVTFPYETTGWDFYPTSGSSLYSESLSKISLQFLVEITSAAPSCVSGEYIPKLVSPTPRQGETFLTNIGSIFQLHLSAQAEYESVQDFKISGPPGMTKSLTGNSQSTKRSMVVEWIPSEHNLGEHVPFCFIAETYNGYQSEMRCVVAVVGPKNLDNIELICHENTMTLIAAKSSDHELYENQFRLNDPQCLVTSNSTHLIASVAYNSCGTEIEETEHEIVFKNQATSFSSEFNVITRKHGVAIPFNCSFPKESRISASFHAHKSDYVFTEAGFGNFTYTFQFYTDDRFQEVENQYPLEVELQELLFMEIQVSSSVPNVQLFVESCKATPYDNPNYPIFYNIIQNGCIKDESFVVYSSTRTQYRFAMEAFAFIGDYSEVYMSCTVLLCKFGDPGTRCSQGCITKLMADSNRQRNRRSLTSESQQHFISQGPVTMKRQSSDADQGKSASLNVNTLVISLSGVVIVAMLGLIVHIYTKRVTLSGYEFVKSQNF